MDATVKALHAVTDGDGASAIGPNFTMQRIIGVAVDGKELREVKALSEDAQHEFQMELVKKFHIRVGRLFK